MGEDDGIGLRHVACEMGAVAYRRGLPSCDVALPASLAPERPWPRYQPVTAGAEARGLLSSHGWLISTGGARERPLSPAQHGGARQPCWPQADIV
jgi:hypothetical protein